MDGKVGRVEWMGWLTELLKVIGLEGQLVFGVFFEKSRDAALRISGARELVDSVEVRLCVISVYMEIKAVLVDDLNKQEHIDGKKEGSKYGSFRHALADWDRGGAGVVDGDKCFLLDRQG